MMKPVDLLFTDLPVSLLQTVRDLMNGVDVSWAIVEPGCSTAAEVIEAASGVRALIPFYAPVTREVFESIPSLEIIALPYVGSDTVDLEAADERGLWVCNVPDGNREEVAVHALGMTLSLLRALPRYDASIRAGRWDDKAAGELRRISGLTFGVLGVGNIGSLIASYGLPLFGRVVGYDLSVPAEQFPAGVISLDSVQALFEQADVISIHVPLTPQTDGLVDDGLLAQCRPGTYLVNAARGPVVDSDALLNALGNGQLRAAALDVVPVEPPARSDPLLHHPDILLSPHAAHYSEESKQETFSRAIANATAVIRGQTPVDALVGP